MKDDLFPPEPNSRPAAVFSPCRRYRYELWREWDKNLPFLQVIGLNPSTADEVNNDPTVRRCIDFARRWGFGALCMTNAFAFRATDPEVMKAQAEPIGPDNNVTLARIARQAGLVLAAWGIHGGFMDRDEELLAMLPALHCLGTTSEGQPRHPLYIKATTLPTPYNAPT